MTTIEKMARAMAERNNDYCEAGLLQWPAYEDDARTAVTALLQPPPEIERFNGSANWTAMITAILEKSE